MEARAPALPRAFPRRAGSLTCIDVTRVIDIGENEKGRTAVEPDALPVEVDPLDWADQHQLVPLPEDDYPHVEELERVMG